MEYTISIDTTKKVIQIITQGEVCVENMTEMTLELLSIAAESKCYNFFLDYRQSIALYSITDTYEFMSKLKNLGFPHNAKVAAVINRDENKHRFAETVAVNRGLNVRYFHDFEEAEAWIKS